MDADTESEGEREGEEEEEEGEEEGEEEEEEEGEEGKQRLVIPGVSPTGSTHKTTPKLDTPNYTEFR